MYDTRPFIKNIESQLCFHIFASKLFNPHMCCLNNLLLSHLLTYTHSAVPIVYIFKPMCRVVAVPQSQTHSKANVCVSPFQCTVLLSIAFSLIFSLLHLHINNECIRCAVRATWSIHTSVVAYPVALCDDSE